jgi:hypothetical protein
MKINRVKQLLSRWQVGFWVLALLAICPITAYAEVSPGPTDGSAVSGAEALEDSVQSDEPPEAQVQLEERMQEEEQFNTVTEEVNQRLGEGERMPDEINVNSDVEAGEVNEEAEMPPESIGEGNLPEADEGAIQVDF